MTNRPPYRDGRIHVLTEKCSTCVMRPGNLMHLKTGRLADLINSNLQADTAFACHQTLYRPDTDQALCRGYVDAYGDQVTPIRAARMFGVITEVPPPPKEKRQWPTSRR